MKKYLGQNFLVNSYVIDYIISHMSIKANDFVFEIGPGKVLSGLVKRINKDVKISSINSQSDIESLNI